MAFEFHDEFGDSSSNNSLDDCINSPWDEEIPFTQSKSYNLDVVPNFDSETKNQRSLEVKHSLGFNPERGIKITSSISSNNSKIQPSDDLGSNGDRSITDLPPALVSEILHCLDAKELGIVSCVSTLLHKLASDHQGWKNFYCERWGAPLGPIPSSSGFTEERSWKNLFVEREFRSKTFMGRYSVDVLYGHTESVLSVFLLSSAKLIFSGGYDSVIRIWDMEEGFSIATSRPLGCTIRAVVADTKLLVAGGTEGFLQCWKSVEGLPHLFDLTCSQNQNLEFRLWEHNGPVTCLALDLSRIYSGSWDMTVRIWDRSLLKCLKVLRHNDWVSSLVPRGSTVVSTTDGAVYVWDIDTGNLVTVIQKAHQGKTCSLARSHTGNLLFTGGEDGAIHMFEITDSNVSKVATWIPHMGAVHSLAFEFPWLVSASNDGKLSLIDVRKLLRPHKRSLQNVEAPQRMLHGFGCNLFSVGIGADRIVSGGEGGVVRIWNFSQALEIEQRVQALRGVRLENRMRRRKVQVEMNSKGGRADRCSIAAKKNQVNGDRSGIWHGRRGVNGKVKV